MYVLNLKNAALFAVILIILIIQVDVLLTDLQTDFSIVRAVQKHDSSQENDETAYERHSYFKHGFFLQSSPFDELRKFTQWCNKTTSKGKGRNYSNETETKEPLNYTSFSMNLVREDFAQFEIEMNTELMLVNKSVHKSNWEDLDSYKIFIALSFCPMADFYEVTTDEKTDHGEICHLMVPTDDNVKNKTAYILNYGLGESTAGLRELAKRELAKMVANGLGADLRDFVPAAKRLYRIFIAFHGPEGAVEHEGPTILRPPGYYTPPTTEDVPVGTWYN